MFAATVLRSSATHLALVAITAAAGLLAQSPHWAFSPPVRNVPAVRDNAWCRDDIDRCVLAGLERAKLTPSAPAEPVALLRRVHLVLTGLPPTPDQITAFTADPSDAAYDRVVDALLADPASAEHMATPWLDLARFADTYGYQADFECRTWPWRDWLLESLRDDKPWDRFVMELVAGDCLLDANDTSRTATAFWRLHRQTNEGGSIDEEWREEYVADRVETFGATFLGMTVGCARCHDHKSDPISQRDYYALGSFFVVDEAGLYPYSTGGVPQPAMRLATAAQEKASWPLQSAIRKAREKVERARDDAGDLRSPTTVAAPTPVGERTFAAPGHLCDGDARLPIPKLPAFTRDDAFSVRLVVSCPDKKDRAVLLHTSHYTQDADTQGYQVLLKDGRVCWEVVHHWPGSAAAVRTASELPLGRPVEIVATYDGSSNAHGLAVYLDGAKVEVDIVRNHLAGPATVRQLELGGRDRDRGFAGGTIHAFALFDRALTPAEVAVLAGKEVDAALHVDHSAARDADVFARQAELTAARKALHAHEESQPELMVMAPFPDAPKRFLLKRGAYDLPDRTQATPAAVPAFLPQLPKFAHYVRTSRLHLAEWLLAPEQPLTARTAVDRLWAQCFGHGLVATPENLGKNGSPPTQPELLDLLAVDFARDRSMKGVLRRIVRSATFRQSSVANASSREADPLNERLARGPSFRLPAEVLRDQALAAAGLLHRQFGGPSVRPFQPPGLWRDAGVGWGGADYKPDEGPNAHRRSLYTFRKRTAPPPNVMTFDGTSREVCTVRRQETCTPLQALVLLGDPVFVECAQALATKANALATNLDDKLAFLFTSFCGRAPRAPELAALRTLHATEADPVLALTLVASAVLASDAAVTVR